MPFMSYAEILAPDVLVLADGAFGRQLGSPGQSISLTALVLL